jgi:transposase
VKFIQAKQQLTELRAQATRGEIDLAFADEAGFDQVSPNSYAWTDIGQEHRHQIDAYRGSRINVIAAIFSNGRATANFSKNTMKALDVAAFLRGLAEGLTKPLVVVLDNASIHKAKANEQLIKELEQKKLHLYFLPPYSPELNRIERLWHKIKYSWLTPKRRTKDELLSDLMDIFIKYGEYYKFNFM